MGKDVTCVCGHEDYQHTTRYGCSRCGCLETFGNRASRKNLMRFVLFFTMLLVISDPGECGHEEFCPGPLSRCQFDA